MIDLKKAKQAFARYALQFNYEDDKIKLKLVHTYGVIRIATLITHEENLSKEDQELACLIALLHDLGRFEQIKRFDTFDDSLMNHAEFGVEVLFTEGKIREFIKDDSYDEIIRKAIEHHSKFQIPEGLSKRELLHAQLIRDADKLDNFRSKNEEKIETMVSCTAEELGNYDLSDNVLQSLLLCQCVKKDDRVTPIDFWVSFLAFLFDLNFKSSYKYLLDTDYINRNIDIIDYTNKSTKQKMENVRKACLDYTRKRCKNFMRETS